MRRIPIPALAMRAGVGGKRDCSDEAWHHRGGQGSRAEEVEVVTVGGSGWGAELAASARGRVGDFSWRQRPSVRTPVPQHYQ
jgi:hypothetical protein